MQAIHGQWGRSPSVVAITIQKTKRPNFLYAKTVVRDAMNPPFQPNVNEQISSAQVPRVPLAAAAPPGENCDSRITIDGRMCGATAALQVGRTKLRHHSPLQNDRPTAYLQFAPPWKSDRAHVYQTRRRRRRRGRNKHPLLPFWTRKTPIVLGVPRLQGAARYRAYIGGN